MRKLFCKIAAAYSMCVLMLSLFGCGKAQELGVSDSDIKQSEETLSEKAEEAAVIIEREDAEATDEEVGNSSQASAEYESREALTDLYNSALEKGSLKRKHMSRKTESGVIDLGIKEIDLNEKENSGLKALTETDDNLKASCPLEKLAREDVEKAEKSENTIVFTLKSRSAGTDISQGEGGYLGIAEKEMTAEILNAAAEYLGLPGKVIIKSGEYTLYDGKITAYFSDDFTALKKVAFSGKEKVKGTVEYIVMTVGVEIEFALSSLYEA